MVLAESEGLRKLAQRYPDPLLVARAAPALVVEVERERARFSSWYEFFPRSAAPKPGAHGTFRRLRGAPAVRRGDEL